MDILFARGEATLTQVQKEMESPPTRPALRSILTILEGKGHLTHRQDSGREFIYLPVLSREEVGQSTLSRVIGTFFGGSVTQALASYLSQPQTQLSADDVTELRRFLDEAKAQNSSPKHRHGN